MYLIYPYKSIGSITLNSSPSEIEQILGKSELSSNDFAPDYLTGYYLGGVAVSYKENAACYIGCIIQLCPTHLDFSFKDKTYSEVIDYFKIYPGNIYIEDEVSVISEFLGISTYFEDGIKEVAIFSNNYGAEIIKFCKLFESKTNIV